MLCWGNRRLPFGLGDLVIFGVFVDGPGVAGIAVQNVFGGDQRGGHRVVLVVVAVLSVAADAVEVVDRPQPIADDVETFLITGVVHRIRLGHANDVTLHQRAV